MMLVAGGVGMCCLGENSDQVQRDLWPFINASRIRSAMSPSLAAAATTMSRAAGRVARPHHPYGVKNRLA